MYGFACSLADRTAAFGRERSIGDVKERVR
jgi:hypothetical protein